MKFAKPMDVLWKFSNLAAQDILRLVFQTRDGYCSQSGPLERFDCVWYVSHAMYCAKVTWINKGSQKSEVKIKYVTYLPIRLFV